MKKLLNKLREKPKLYKCLKILGVVGICLSLIFNAIIIGSAISMRHGNNNDNKVPSNLVTTPIKGLYPADMNSQRHNIYTIADLCSPQGYYCILNYLRNIDYYAPIYNFQGETMYMNLIEYGGQDNMDNVINLGTYTFDQYNNPTTIFNARRIRFYSTLQTQPNGKRRRFLFMGLGNDGNNEEYQFEYYDYYESGISKFGGLSGNLITSNCKFTTNWTSIPGNIVTELALYSPKPMVDYVNGDASVLDLMFYDLFNSNSWSLGYSAGYQDGLVAQPAEDTSSPFALLAKGFETMASILNIQVLPNLSLGVLIFTPLIVTIIIVVVKMVKG